MRRTSAISRRRIKRPFDRKLMSSRSFSDLNAPDTRIDKLLVAGLQRTRGAHGVLRLERSDQRGPVDPEPRKLLRREFDIDLFVLRAKNLDLGNVWNLQQFRTHILDIVANSRWREPVSGESRK